MDTITTLPAADALDSETLDFKDSPGDWGLDLGSLGSHAKGTWDRQQRYLSHYSREPFQSRSAKAAGISDSGDGDGDGDGDIRGGVCGR